jgi:hypothetical protein
VTRHGYGVGVSFAPRSVRVFEGDQMSGENLTIRELEAADLDVLLALYGDLHASDEPVLPERAQAVWSAIKADPAQQ